MHSWIYLAICSVFVSHSVTSNCITDKCSLQDWVVTDCSQCCKINASPISAIQKRIMCCPDGFREVDKCIAKCNFPINETEKNDSCTLNCQNKCPGGFHFATTTTSTTVTTTPTTTTTSTASTTSTTVTTTPTTTTTSTASTTVTTTQTTTTTSTASATAQTTPGPTITSSVSSNFEPVYLSSIKKPFDDKSTKPESCTTRNNTLKDGVPFLVWLPLLGVLLGSVATICIFWIARKKQKRVIGDNRPSMKRNGPAVPMFRTANDKDVKMNIIAHNTRGRRKTPNYFGNNLAF